MQKKRGLPVILLVGLALIAVIWVVGFNFNDQTYVVVITGQQRIVSGGNSYYLIFARDLEGNYFEFRNVDNWLRGKFNSSSFQNQIHEGYTYELTVIGFRFYLFSWYKNIIDFQLIE